MEEKKIKKVKVRRIKDKDNNKGMKIIKVESKKNQYNNLEINCVKKDYDDIYFYDDLHYENYKFKKKKNNKKRKKKKLQGDNFTIASRGRKRLNVTKISKEIISQNLFKFLNNEIYMYDKKNGYFRKISGHELDVIIYDSLNKKLRDCTVLYDIQSIRKFISIDKDIQVDECMIETNIMKINCKNGIVNLKTGKLEKHNPDEFFRNVINASYYYKYSKEEFQKSKFYQFLITLTNDNKELIRLIQEIVGYTLSNINNAKKLIILYGVSNSGKSTFLDLIQYMLGKENISNIPLQRLFDEKYCAELYNKLANIYNELPDYGIKDLGQIKALVSESDEVSARRLYGDPFSFKNRATLLFATNNLPKLISRSEYDNTAFFNRLLIIPFVNSIKEKNQNKNLLEEMKEEIDLIFEWSIKGILRYIDNGFRFSGCAVSEEYLNIYRSNEDIIGDFVRKKILYSNMNFTFWSDIKKELQNFCEKSGKLNITTDEFRFAKKLIEDEFSVKYTKIHTNENNKWGFRNISICI